MSNWIALIFSKQGKYDESLQNFIEIYKIRQKRFGENHIQTLTTKNCMGVVYYHKNEIPNAMKIFQEVFNSSQNFYPEYPITLSAKSNIAMVLLSQGKHHEALKLYREVLASQQDVLDKQHYDIAVTKYHIALILRHQNQWTDALQLLQEVFEVYNKVLGAENRDTLHVKGQINSLKLSIDSVFKAVGESNLKKIKKYTGESGDVNLKNTNGETLLHCAIKNGNIEIINFLLKSGADVTKVCKENKTSLYIAASKGLKNVVEILLQQNFETCKLNEFIDAKVISDGTASLHIAAKNGFLEIVLSLLKRGATYDIQDKNGKTPLELSQKRNITNLLELIEEMFQDAKHGNSVIINKLEAIRKDENKFAAVINARDNQGHTLLQVTLFNRHKNIASKLVEMIK